MSIRVAILGATGVVGQKAIALLTTNPRFKIIELVASDQRISQTFGEVCCMHEPLLANLPKHIASIKFNNAQNLTADLIISCLPDNIAANIEPMLAAQGKLVFSNASTFRMQQNVPLLVPEINPQHLSLLAKQNTPGKIIASPNCSAIGTTLALAPLFSLGEISHVSIVTLQSISGAGYPGLSSLDILGNTIPYIPDEATKITQETKKILGSATKPAEFAVTTHVHRVPVLYGHTITLHVTFKTHVTPEQAIECYQAWNTRHPDLFVVHHQNGRPQTNIDLQHNDMRAHIGHVNQGGKPNILGLVSLTHNLVRGAAGGVIASMERVLHYQTEELNHG